MKGAAAAVRWRGDGLMTFEELVRAVEVDIVFGVYPGNSRLTEESLTSRFGVKRHLVREAFSHLEKMGFVQRIPNRGVVVNELKPRQVEEIYEVRVLLETGAARITPLPAPPGVVAEMERIQDSHEQAVRDGNFRRVFYLNIDFHRLQYSICPNAELASAIADFARRAHMIRALQYSDARHMQMIVRQHRAIIAALKGRSTEAYVKSVAAHFPASPEEYRKHFERKYGVGFAEQSGAGPATAPSARASPGGLHS
jgi:DNA-binding GntR family transcriptional regulator